MRTTGAVILRADSTERGTKSCSIVCTLLVCGILGPLVACHTSAGGAEVVARPSTEPNASPEPDVVARVLGADIVAADLTQNTAAEHCRELAQKLAGPLFEAYRRENGITADEDEIAACQAALAHPSTKAPLPASIAQAMVIGYKIDRQLYAAYGGDVIFQQANPFQPVGAYRAFLAEQERLGRFEIVDDDYRECFWREFSAIHSRVVPESDVDFSQPWWERMRGAQN